MRCTCVPQGLGRVAAIRRQWPFSAAILAGPTQRSELGRRFRLSGEDQDLHAIFSPAVEQAILRFPCRIQKVMFDGKAASVSWYGRVEDPAIVDAALDLAAIIAR